MSVTQTVEVPASHRLTIDVPSEVPTGPVILTFTPAKKPAGRGSDRVLSDTETLEEVLSQPTPLADSLLGILSDLGDITLEQIRDERLARQLK
ncbi:MAG: hypothetical protein LBQ69_04895 [Treponema sp.]|jgi:hypothetical protein|nr:hypothetical protein [Treponema sp.]